MFAGALLLRLAVAPYTGFYLDLVTYQGWVTGSTMSACATSTPRASSPTIRPATSTSSGSSASSRRRPGYLLLKLPAIVADLGVAWLAGVFAVRLAGCRSWSGGRFGPRRRRRALQPRRVRRQRGLGPGRLGSDAVRAGLAPAPLHRIRSRCSTRSPRSSSSRSPIAIKPQSGFVLPVVLYALYRRYLYRRSSVSELRRRPAIVLLGLLALGVWVFSGLPFGLGPVSLVDFYATRPRSVRTRAERVQPLGRLRILAQRFRRHRRDDGRRGRRRSGSGRCCSSPRSSSCSGAPTVRSSAAPTRRSRSRSPPPRSACSASCC